MKKVTKLIHQFPLSINSTFTHPLLSTQLPKLMIPSMTIDQLIESKWYETYESYSINHNLPIDKTIKLSLPSITQEQQQQQQQQQQQEQVPTKPQK